VFEHGQHHDVIELSRWQRPRLPDVGSNQSPPSALAALHLIVDPNALGNPVRGKIQESRVQSAA
jgi:hypothetical protein